MREPDARFTLTLDELREIYRVDQASSGVSAGEVGDVYAITEYDDERIVASTSVGDDNARKGGSVAGLAIFRFFDAMGYLVTLAQSPKGTEAFTCDVSIHFLRPAPVGSFLIEGRPLKFGRRASIVAVTVSSPLVTEGPVASGVVTYAPVFPKG